MRRLMLLRHAKSDWPDGVADARRPLAKRGRTVAPLVGRYMARQGLRPDLALVSTARRARETWELVRAAFAVPVPERLEPRLYEASAGELLDVIGEIADDVHALLLVGHNPGLHDTALTLVGTGGQSDLARLRQKYPTAGLVVIDFDAGRWSEVSRTRGRLERFATPKSIADEPDAEQT